MFARSVATKVYLAVGTTDLRKGFYGLYVIVEGVLQGIYSTEPHRA